MSGYELEKQITSIAQTASLNRELLAKAQLAGALDAMLNRDENNLASRFRSLGMAWQPSVELAGILVYATELYQAQKKLAGEEPK